MGKKQNETFMEIYLELDKLCCTKFGIPSGGVTEYINRLNNARFAPSRDEVLPRLVRYRNLRNNFAHEPGFIRKSNEVTKDDIKWVDHFRHDVLNKRDPVAKYLRSFERYALEKKVKKVLFAFLGVLAVALIVAIIILIKNLLN